MRAGGDGGAEAGGGPEVDDGAGEGVGGGACPPLSPHATRAPKTSARRTYCEAISVKACPTVTNDSPAASSAVTCASSASGVTAYSLASGAGTTL